MANIKPYLDKIRSAIFGEEVRGSIIDAITIMNNESSQAKNEATAAEEQARTSAIAAQESEKKAEQSAAHSAKIDKMTVSASKLTAGTTPTVTISDDGTKKHLTFGIPKGDKGDTGSTPNITVGEIVTGEPGSNAVVSIHGTTENPILDFTIPRGDPGTVDGIPVKIMTKGTGFGYSWNVAYYNSDSGEVFWRGLRSKNEITGKNEVQIHVNGNAAIGSRAYKEDGTFNERYAINKINGIIPPNTGEIIITRTIVLDLSTSSWSGSGPYTATISNPDITEKTWVDFNLTESTIQQCYSSINWETNGGKITLTTNEKPAHSLKGTLILTEVVK